MQVALAIQGVKDNCDAVIEIVDVSDSDETCLSALLAIDPTWQGLSQVQRWAVSQLTMQVTQSGSLQV